MQTGNFWGVGYILKRRGPQDLPTFVTNKMLFLSFFFTKIGVYFQNNFSPDIF